MKGGDMSSVSPLVSFVLGAAMATVCVLFFMSATPARRLVDISAFTSNNNNSTAEGLQRLASDSDAADALAATATATPAPAPAPVQVRTRARAPPSVFPSVRSL
jgi:hypothetical protein